ncbi:hypothetical protein [Mangrovicoccus sp. HB161399]|uniref:hypothetical protein n=1 Tax=Mangrovicoccus sp. HB161399 TaxID=2720392 RepID=UPI001557EBBC|nr:hypothetical protein [Mangrovicoccus sp. HB161399]
MLPLLTLPQLYLALHLTLAPEGTAEPGGSGPFNAKVFHLAALSGAFGAALGMALRVRSTLRISQMRETKVMTIARILAGSTTALIFVLVQRAGWIGAGFLDAAWPLPRTLAPLRPRIRARSSWPRCCSSASSSASWRGCSCSFPAASRPCPATLSGARNRADRALGPALRARNPPLRLAPCAPSV